MGDCVSKQAEEGGRKLGREGGRKQAVSKPRREGGRVGRWPKRE